GRREAHRPLLLAGVRRAGCDRQRQGERLQVRVQRRRARQRAARHLHRDRRKQGLAERHGRSRWSRTGHVHGEASMTRHIIVSFAAAVIMTCAIVYVVSGFSRTVSAQTIDAAAVYQKNCATCHDQPKDRTPPRDALKDRRADAILQSLTTGTMSVNAISLSMAEKRAVAEYLAGKPVTAGGEVAGMCANRPGTVGNVSSGWNGWGNDTANSRYQPKPGITAAEVPNLK